MTSGKVLESATKEHRAGRLAEAEVLYRQVLAREPKNADALHRLAVLSLQRGQKEAAVELAGRASAIHPESPLYQWATGQALFACGRHDEAIERLNQAIALRPEFAEAYFDLGNALHGKGSNGEAIKAYEKALELRPEYVEARLNLGNVFHTRRQYAEAERVYREALAVRPDSAEIYNNLGSALQCMKQLPEAMAAFGNALELKPDHVRAMNNMGGAFQTLGRLDEAVAILRKARALQPNFVEAAYNLGNALWASGDWNGAAASFREAIALKPGHFGAYNNLGALLKAQGDSAGAEAAYRAAIKCKPDYLEAYNNLGSVLRAQGRADEALEAYGKAIALQPRFALVHSNYANVLKDMGQLDEAVASYRRASELSPDDAVVHSNLAYTLYFHPDYDGPAILKEHRLWNQRHAERLAGEIRAHENDPTPERRLRVGYVSPDFRNHCQAFFTVPLFSNHNHERFEIFCYANVPRPDKLTEFLRGKTDVWQSTVRTSDAGVAAMVREDKIDVLVDLTMHMAHGRALMFARKPAPVQVAWLAYPGTTGVAAMDYRLTDPYLDPPGEHEDHYSEESIRLPDTFWCYDALNSEPGVNELPALERGYVTFGCLNNLCKVTERMLGVWARVLTACAGSRLMMLAPFGAYRERILATLAAGGVDQSRVEFMNRQSREKYMEAYHGIDLGLDTLPYNGHTTSLDSYWMGVPVVTLVGDKAVGRAGWSQLCNLDMRELATTSEEEFVRIATELAGDLGRLKEIRAGLRMRMAQSPLMDGKRFARNIEGAYREMWRRWCATRAGVGVT